MTATGLTPETATVFAWLVTLGVVVTLVVLVIAIGRAHSTPSSVAAAGPRPTRNPVARRRWLRRISQRPSAAARSK